MSPVFPRLAMTSVFVSNGIAFGAWAASLPRLREQAGLTDSQLGVVLLAVAGGAAAAMPATGVIATRLGSGWVVLLAALLIPALLPLPALTPGGWLLLGAAAALGVGLGAMDVAMNARGAEVERHWGSPIMSSFHAGWSLGGLTGSSLVGVLSAADVGLAATMGCAAAAVFVLAVPGLILREGRDIRAASSAAAASRRFAWPSPALLAVGLLACLCFLSEASVMDWSGVYLHTVLGADMARATGGFAGFSAAMVVGRLLGDMVVRRLGPPRVVRLGALVGAIGLATALAVPDPVVAIGGFALVGLGLSNVVPVMFSAASRRGGPAGVAMAASLGYAGLMGGPVVIGLAADAMGLRVALGLVLLCLVGIVLLAAAADTRPARTAAVARG